MSKGAKSKSREHRKKKKAELKEANRAQFAAWRDAGTNAKSKRHRSGRKQVLTESHPLGKCGNTACQRCNNLRGPRIGRAAWVAAHDYGHKGYFKLKNRRAA